MTSKMTMVEFIAELQTNLAGKTLRSLDLYFGIDNDTPYDLQTLINCIHIADDDSDDANYEFEVGQSGVWDKFGNKIIEVVR